MEIWWILLWEAKITAVNDWLTAVQWSEGQTKKMLKVNRTEEYPYNMRSTNTELRDILVMKVNNHNGH